MPGKKPKQPKPAAYLITAEPQLVAAWTDAESRPQRIEAFPLEEDASPEWVDLPSQLTVKQLTTFALPQGAHPMPLYDPTGQATLRPIRSSTVARTRVLLVGEGYSDDGRDQFFADCDHLSARLLATPPFNLAADRLAIDGLFLPLSGGAVVDIGCNRTESNLRRLRPTLFGTQCCLDGRTERLWGGDEDRVRKVTGKALSENHRSLGDYLCLAVLINSNEYGGAGSVASEKILPRIAWATTGHPQSLDILLHELGHALGLQDEYETDQAEPAKPWRNISNSEVPRDTPWRLLATEDPDRVTLAHGLDWPENPQAVGTFEGAAYQATDRFRPSFDCRMRHVRSNFCPVCSDHIRARLDPNHAGRVGSED